jgi:hypothetical protein
MQVSVGAVLNVTQTATVDYSDVCQFTWHKRRYIGLQQMSVRDGLILVHQFGVHILQ